MADKKLNEVTTVNSGTLANVKNFLAVMKDGSIQQMSKEDMASVVGGLIGLASETKDGLMNTLAFSSTNVYPINNYMLYKLFTLDENWDRKFAVIEYGIGEQNCYAMVSGYNRPTGVAYKLNKTFNTDVALKFYHKDKAVYLFCNITGSLSKALIRSTDVVTLARQGSADMSGYTEITS